MNNHNEIDAFFKETGGWVASQLEACTRCGMCAEACHYYQATGVPEYTPIWKAELLRRAYEQRFTISGRVKRALGIEKPFDDETLDRFETILFTACTLCNKCALVCPMGIDLGSLLHAARGGLTALDKIPPDMRQEVNSQVEKGSPLGLDKDAWLDRLEWVEDEYEVEIPVDVKGAETLVVFTSIEVMKFPRNLAAIAQIMNAAKESWTVSTKGREVVNYGLFVGSSELTRLFLSRLFDAAKELGVKRIMVTECGHAFEALRWTSYNLMEVPDGLEITHIVRRMVDFIESGRIKLKAGNFDEGKITFHDACKIQRKGGFIEEPRKILNLLSPHAFIEMTPNREQAICCGGGGGVIGIKAADDNRYAAFQLKMEQIMDIDADTVSMVCSNCRLQFTDSLRHFNSDIKVMGLSQMVADSLVE